MFLYIIIPIVCAIIIVLGIIYFHYENTSLQNSYFLVNTDKSIPENGLKIAQISDFHNCRSKKLTDSVIDSLTGEKVDIIVITGDLIDSRCTNVNVAVDFVACLCKVARVFYVAGNHEARKEREYAILKKSLQDLGATVLENSAVSYIIDGVNINFSGILDPRFCQDDTMSKSEYIKNSLSSLNNDNFAYSILLSHRPEFFNEYSTREFDLVFCGHAHGGQFRILNKGIFAPGQGFFPKYSYGRFDHNGTTMIVSRGLGNTLFPLRLNNRPNLIIVNVKRSD